MNQQFEGNSLEKIISDVVSINPRGQTPLTGYMAKIIRRDGKYVEGGLVFDENDFLFAQLYSGVAVLARDMYHYLKDKDRDDAKSFNGVVKAVQKKETAIYNENAFPSYNIVPDEIPRLDIKAADNGEPMDLTLLSEIRIIREWNFKPGKRFINELCMSDDIRQAVCKKVSKNDFISKIGEGVKTVSVVKVTEAIVTATFSATTLWYPLAAYAAVYILSKAIKAYCPQI